MKNSIILKGTREHNLKNIDVEFPRNEMALRHLKMRDALNKKATPTSHA